MAVKASMDFGWSLADIFNPRVSRLQHFRSNLLSGDCNEARNVPSSTKMAVPPTRMSRWTSDLSLIQQSTPAGATIRQRTKGPRRQGSQGSQSSSGDSCVGSEVASWTTSEESSYSECSPVLLRRQLQRHSRTLSLASDSMACWQGAFQHALTVMEEREDEMNSVFHELREIHDDLTQMSDQVGQATDSLRQVKQLTASPRSSSEQRQHTSDAWPASSGVRWPSQAPASAPSPVTCSSSGKRKIRHICEDEMADIAHRVLKHVCELSLARSEGRCDVPLLV